MSKAIEDLHPSLQSACRLFLLKCKLEHLDVRILFTYRSPTQQNELYAQGRTKPGKIVTNLKGDKSKHCFTIDGKPAAKAFDFGVFKNGKYITRGDDPDYIKAAQIGEALGLESGIHWKQPNDPGHLQIK